MESKECKYCGKKFTNYPSRLGEYCSPSCANEARKEGPRYCNHCKTLITEENTYAWNLRKRVFICKTCVKAKRIAYGKQHYIPKPIRTDKCIECQGEIVQSRSGKVILRCTSCRKKRFNQKSQERYGKLRKQALDLVGRECFICKRNKGIQLHHKWYGEEGSPWKIYKSTSTMETASLKEVLVHPERFAPLCFVCHRFITRVQKNPQVVERLNELIRISNTREIASYVSV